MIPPNFSKMKPIFLYLLLFCLTIQAGPLRGATGSATTGDVTVDTRRDNARLSSLSLVGRTISPVFNSNELNYTSIVVYNTPSLPLRAITEDPEASLEYRSNDGAFVPLTSGISTSPIPLTMGDTGIEVRVTAQDGTTQEIYSITVTQIKAPQTIQQATIGNRFINETYLLSPVGGNSGNPVVFELLSGPAVLDEFQLNFTGPGTVTIVANQEGNDNYDAAAPLQSSFEVILPVPDVAVGSGPNPIAGREIYAPAQQSFMLLSKKARPVVGYIQIHNRALLSNARAKDRLNVSGTAGGGLFQVSYLSEEGNISAGMASGTYRTPAIDGSDTGVTIRANVTPNKKRLIKKKGRRTIVLRKSQLLQIRASSEAYSSAFDSAVIQVMTR